MKISFFGPSIVRLVCHLFFIFMKKKKKNPSKIYQKIFLEQFLVWAGDGLFANYIVRASKDLQF